MSRPDQPFEPLDKACLASSSRAHGLSNAPTWELTLDGQPDWLHIQLAWSWLMNIYPWCLAIAAPSGADGGRSKTWNWRWIQSTGDELAISQLRNVDLRAASAAEIDAHGDAIRDRFLDLEREPGARLDVAWLPGGKSRFWFQQHHGLADGRAFIELLDRFAALLDLAAAGGRPDDDALAPSPRRGELDATGLGPWQRRRLALRGLWIYVRGLLRSLRRAPTALRQNRSLDYSGRNRSLHRVLRGEREAALRATAARHGWNLHAALLAAWVLANLRWNAEAGVTCERLVLSSIVELRPRDGGFRSFANHLGWALPELDVARLGALDGDVGRAAVCRALHTELRRQTDRREPLARSLFERAPLLALPLAGLRAAVCAPKQVVVQLNVSNVLAIPIPAFEGRGFRCEAVRVTTPVAPRYGVLLTATRHRDVATLNLNFKDSVVAEDQAARLADLLEQELDALAALAIG